MQKLRTAACAGAVILILCGALAAQSSRSSAGNSVSPRFDYYLLALSWAPEFCAQPGMASTNPKECATGNHIGFVVHGLWPEPNEGRGPESCGPAKPVRKLTMSLILPYMPSPGLIQHEWATHGTCTGLTASDYFTAVLQARAALQIPVQLTALEERVNESPGMIETQFAKSNPAWPQDAFRVSCRNGALAEVRVCFDKDLKARSCTVSAGECRAVSIAIPPPL